MLFYLLACTGKEPGDVVFETDSGAGECGRIRGTTSALMYDADNVNSVHYPTEAPDDVHRTTGIAGPVGELGTLILAASGRIARSDDGGCNWSDSGSLPASNNWQLIGAGGRFYAFDRDSADAARSDDLGLSWTPFSTGSPLWGLPGIDPTDAAHLVAARADEVVTSTDGGDTWAPTASLPDTGGVNHVAVAPSLDVVGVAGTNGVWISRTGGASWDDRSVGLPESAETGRSGVKVAISPDDTSVVFVVTVDAVGVYSVSRTPDAGVSWVELGGSAGFGLDGASPLWAVPGNSALALTAFFDAADAEFPLHLNVSAPEEGTHIVKVANYQGMTGMVFTGSEYVASVHGVPAR